ncbi:HAMP domain-containing histidine kinase [Nitrogeniibacter mangrovi]|uniref:histidine kinase n=1 Tax=Nitrogeniibacter mangrovi TaxID=2016596 RepID=A0A6C1B7V0_9RHOO|nr:HAMP domain-containing sensor histidine kinase [Nitrogeniibacter mangrovi]QID19019.1 HAMP domain-containing histidine kinase [Nitrogeniibacter mangrovi]
MCTCRLRAVVAVLAVYPMIEVRAAGASPSAPTALAGALLACVILAMVAIGVGARWRRERTRANRLESRIQAQERELARHRGDLAELVAEQTVDLLLAKEAAERARCAQADFLAGLALELRGPLHAIGGYAQLGCAATGKAAREHVYFSRIDRSAQHMLTMVTELCDLPSATRTGGPVALGPVDWAAVCREVVARGDALLRAKRLSVSMDVAPDLTPVHADQARLREVAEHLFSNAVKFSPVGARIDIRLHEAPDGAGDVVLEVADQGTGLAEEVPERLFGAYGRDGATGSMAVPVGGLGLSICRQHVEIFGGRIEAGNRAAGGAVFRVWLPGLRRAGSVSAEAPG